MFSTVGQGLIASAIAAVMIAAHVALGSLFLAGVPDEDEIAAPAAFLIGSGITSFVLALCAAAGVVGTAVAATVFCGTIILVARRRRVMRILRAAVEPLRDLARGGVLRVALLMVVASTWLSAIAPPRSADAMRYHLAHIRQIVAEGQWTTFADYHYALPFGWSLSYLPFEILGLPQGAQLLGIWLFVLVFATVFRALENGGASRGAALCSAALLVHPAVVRAFVEAGADAYSLMAVLTIALLLARLPRLDGRAAGLLGFSSWIGLQSRYQLVAAGIAATLVTMAWMRPSPDRRRLAGAWSAGALGALALASPFYVANAVHFGNPFWPLMIGLPSAESSYADIVAWTYSDSLNGSHTLANVAGALVTLLTRPYLFPLPLLIAGFIAWAAVARTRTARAPGWFGIAFLLLWVAVQPLLYPRFILLMAPVAALSAGVVLSAQAASTARVRWLKIAASSAILIFATVNAATSWDAVRFVFTSDARAYHRFTWFYPVYQWVNRSTPEDARFLVIVSSAHTYYLDKQYRRADPWVSGFVDWPATNTARALDELMEQEGYSYIIYEVRDWSLYPGGTEMQGAVSEGIAAGALTPIRSFDARLYTSRLWRQYRTTRVLVLKRTQRYRRIASLQSFSYERRQLWS